MLVNASGLATNLDIFGEALVIVPLVHVPVLPMQHVLAIGPGAAATAAYALRYPTFAEVVVIGDQLPQGLRQDKRVRMVARLEDLAPEWRADLVTVSLHGMSEPVLQQLRKHMQPGAVASIALDRASALRSTKELLKRNWPNVAPYREHCPEASWFFLVSDRAWAKHRPVPAVAKRMTDRYLPALFTLAKDEYNALFGGAS